MGRFDEQVAGPMNEERKSKDAGPMVRAPVGATPASPAARDVQTPAVDRSSDAEIAQFVSKVRALAPTATTDQGRLIFAMDATQSRQPTWDMALGLQADMFSAVKDVGGLAVQLLYFRGAGECRASPWVNDPETLARLMTTVHCRAGYTQLGKVLSHARQETETRRVHALVYVGDCMEEDVDDVCGRAGELALLGLPVFVFQEGHEPTAELTFREIAKITKGAYCRFDRGSAAQLRALLTAVATYASGGRQALKRLADFERGGARLLLEQMSPKP